jgi:hypothetical protein
MCALTNPSLKGRAPSSDAWFDMRQGYVRGILIGSIIIGLVCVLLGDWLVVAAMTINSFAMVRVMRRHNL